MLVRANSATPGLTPPGDMMLPLLACVLVRPSSRRLRRRAISCRPFGAGVLVRADSATPGLTPPGDMMSPLRGWRAGTCRFGDPGAYAAGLYDVAPSGLACWCVPIRQPRGLRRRAI